ncbi:PTCHD3 [Branchiostoma lanceolatum]|uniref:PTCHD3 protein n=1 Tax=Branchiostoma lanceolatum TaxID=7740 RepID=A0A8J9Z5A1_BRALA|nr:PTCHD3 [Branchiostoma lanceolatum]
MLFDCIEKNLKTWFGFFGCFVSRHEVFFLVGPLCVSGLLGAGLSHVRTDRDIDSLFSPYNAPARKERAALGGLFPAEEPWEYRNPVQHGDGNYVRVLLTSSGSGNILTERYLQWVRWIDTLVTSEVVTFGGANFTYRDICAFQDDECAGEDFRRLLNVLDIGDGSLSYPVTMLEDGRRLFVGNLLGRIVPAPIKNLLTSVASAGAVQLLYYLRTNDSLHDHVAKLWEDEVERKLLKLNPPDVGVVVSTARTLEREYLENSAGIIPRFAGTVLLALFATGALCFTADCVRSKPLLGVGGVVTACFSGLASAGLISLCGGAFTTTLVPLPVLLLGSSLHDTYSMLSSWRLTSERDDVKTRMSETYQRAVVPMVFTYVIHVVFFGVGAITPVPVIRTYCLYGFVLFFFNFLYFITMFGVFLSLTGRREARRLHCILLHTKPEAAERTVLANLLCGAALPRNSADSKAPTRAGAADEQESALHPFMRSVKESYAPFITQIYLKPFIILLYCAYLSVSLVGCLQVREGILPKTLINYDSQSSRFFRVEEDFFTDFGPRIAVVLRGPVRYWDPAVHDDLENLTRTFESIPHISAPDTDAWFRDYRAYLNTVVGLKRADKQKYLKRLHRHFLNTTAFRRFRSDIVFKNNQKNIRASRFFLQSKKTSNYKEWIAVMNAARKVARESDLNVTVYNPAFMFLDQFAPVLPEALENLGIAGFCFLVFALFTVTNFRSSMWVAVITMSVMTGLIGFLTVLGTNLDPATLGYSVFAAGFCIQATSPIVFAFVRAQGPTRTKCMQSTLVYYSMPAVQTCLTMMFAVLPFTTAPSYIFYSLFQAVFTLCALVMLHAVVVMPVIMTVVGPSKEEELSDSAASTPNKETSSGPYQVSAV